MSAQPTVLILGARGRFGRAATRAFAQAGWHVLAQVRPGSHASDSQPKAPGVTLLPIDIADESTLLKAAVGASVVIHALNPLYTNEQWRTDAPALLEKSIALCHSLQACLMLPGNVYNYGQTMPQVLSENTPQLASTVKGRARMAMEQRLAHACADGRMRAVVIRAGDFFGSGKGSWLDQTMATKLPKGRFNYPGTLETPRAWAYLPDLAKAFVLVANKRSELPAFDTFHFSGYELTGHDWLHALSPIATAQGWLKSSGALKVAGIPWGLIRWGAYFNQVWASLLEMRYLWETPHRLEGSKLAAFIGQEPHTAFPDALHASLQDLGLFKAPASGLTSIAIQTTR